MLRAPLGSDAVLRGLAGLGLAFLISIILYGVRAIGGGDVKLLAGVGAFLGSGDIVGALSLIAVLGAAFALLSVTRRGMLPLLIWNTMELVKSFVNLGQSGKARGLDSPAGLTIPYGVPIAAGTLIWWFGKGVRL